MASKVFQVQAKDSVVALNGFVTINAVQNLSLDPTFNEENFSELGNINFTDQARTPETSGSFETTGTGSVASVLARMLFDYTNQNYLFDPSTKGNVFTITETDFEDCVFDLINLKQPGESFSEATLVPYAQLTGLTLRVDAAGSATETYSFEANLQEGLYTPYHDIVSIPLLTQSATEADINATDYPTIDSGTHALLYAFVDDTRYDSTQAAFTSDVRVDITGANLEQTAPFDRVHAVLMNRTPGTFPTIYYPTTARFMRGDRIDIWLVNSGVSSFTDTNRLLRCQSADITVDLTRDRLQEIKRNDTLSTTYFRGLNFPLTITANVNILETTLQQWADLQSKTLNPAADFSSIDPNNIVDLVDFDTMKLVVKYYPASGSTPICTVTLDNMDITGFGESQQVNGRAERALTYTCSEIEIVGANG